MREESKRQESGASDMTTCMSATRDDELDASAANTAALSAVDRELGSPVQRRGAGPAEARTDESIHAHAARGVAGASQQLPHLDRIQASFGPAHDLSSVRAHVGGEAAQSSRAIGADAYATGQDVAFAREPDLLTAAHEAAHVVQQQEGVSLLGGVGRAGDAHEEHADRVASAVVAGEPASSLLEPHASAAPCMGHVQRREASTDISSHATEIGDEKRSEALADKTSKFTVEQLRDYVTDSMILAMDAFCSAAQTAQLRRAMKKPDHSLWEIVIEFYFGAIPVKNLAAGLDKAVGNVGDGAIEHTQDALNGLRGAGKVAAKNSLPGTASQLDDFFASLRDSARQWTQAMFVELATISDRTALQSLASAFDLSKHTEARYLAEINALTKHYENEVLTIGATEAGHDIGETFYANTQVALVTDGKRHRLAIVSNQTSKGPNARLLDGVTTAGTFFFERWVDDSVDGLARQRQKEAFGSRPIVAADKLYVHTRDGTPVAARGNNADLDQWMDYGDDYELWPSP
jgi:hypothetical protein